MTQKRQYFQLQLIIILYSITKIMHDWYLNFVTSSRLLIPISMCAQTRSDQKFAQKISDKKKVRKSTRSLMQDEAAYLRPSEESNGTTPTPIKRLLSGPYWLSILSIRAINRLLINPFRRCSLARDPGWYHSLSVLRTRR